VSVIFWAVEQALCALYRKMAILAEELAAAQWDLILWQSNLGARRLSAIEVQETAGSVWLQVKIPHWLDTSELDVQQVGSSLLLSLELRERVTVPGYCDFLYSPDYMQSTIPLPAELSLKQAFWDPITHLYTITLSKGIFSSYEYAPIRPYGLPTLPPRSYSLA
jgi:hypothetical protein